MIIATRSAQKLNMTETSNNSVENEQGSLKTPKPEVSIPPRNYNKAAASGSSSPTKLFPSIHSNIVDDFTPMSPSPNQTLSSSSRRIHQSSPSLLDLSPARISMKHYDDPKSTPPKLAEMDQWSGNERLDNHRACDIMTPTIRNISSVVAEDECGRVRNLDATNSGLAMIPLPPNETSIHSFDGSFDGYSGGSKLDSGSEHNTMSSPTILLPRSKKYGRIKSLEHFDLDTRVLDGQVTTDEASELAKENDEYFNVVKESDLSKSAVKLRRLKSEGCANLGDASQGNKRSEGKSVDSDELKSLEEDIFLEKSLLQLSEDASDSEQLRPFQPTRSHLRELSFTECGVKEDKRLDSIFISRKSQSARNLSVSKSKASLYTSPNLSMDRVPSIRMARHLHSTISSGGASSASYDENTPSARFIRNGKSEGSIEESMHFSPKSAIEWLREIEEREEVLAEAASSRFLTRRASAV